MEHNSEKYSSNRFAKALILDLLSSTLIHLDPERIKEYVENNKYNLHDLQGLFNQENEARESYKEEIVESEDDFFPSISLEPEPDTTNEINNDQPEYEGIIEIKSEEFVKLDQRDQYLALCNTDSHQARVIFAHYYETHNSGQKNDIALTVAFVQKLIELISSKNAQINKSKLKSILIRECLESLLKLVYTYSDEVRYKTIEFIVSLIKLKLRNKLGKLSSYKPVLDIGSIKSLNLAQAIQGARTDLRVWIDQLGHHTYGTKIYDMSPSEARAILSAYRKYYFKLDGQNKDDVEQLKQLEVRLDKIIKEDFNGIAFFKLSSRSPKDAVFERKEYKKMFAEEMEKWKKEFNLPADDEKVPQSIKQAVEQKCAAHCMAMDSGAAIVEMLTTSSRAYLDLREALEMADEFDIQIILRSFRPTPVEFELRSFMRNRKLNAMTQYFSKCYFPWVTMEDWKQIKQKVLKYFNEEVAHLLPMPDGTIDFVVYPDKIMVIEVNVYGEMAGSGLFDWKKDQDVMYNGPFEFRVVKDQDLTPVVVE